MGDKKRGEWDGVVPTLTERMRRELDRYEPKAPEPSRSTRLYWQSAIASPAAAAAAPEPKFQMLLKKAAEQGETEAFRLFEASPKISPTFFDGARADWVSGVFAKANSEALEWLMENWCLKRLKKDGLGENNAWMNCAAEALSLAQGHERIMSQVERACEIAGETKAAGVRWPEKLLERIILKIAPKDYGRMLRLADRLGEQSGWGAEREAARRPYARQAAAPVSTPPRACKALELRSHICFELMQGARQARGEGNARAIALMGERAREALLWLNGRPVGDPALVCSELSGLPGCAHELVSTARAWGVEQEPISDPRSKAVWGLPYGMKAEWDPEAEERRLSLVSCALYQNELEGARELMAAGAWWSEVDFFDQKAAYEKALDSHATRLRREAREKGAERLTKAARGAEALALGLSTPSPEGAGKARVRI